MEGESHAGGHAGSARCRDGLAVDERAEVGSKRDQGLDLVVAMAAKAERLNEADPD